MSVAGPSTGPQEGTAVAYGNALKGSSGDLLLQATAAHITIGKTSFLTGPSGTAETSSRSMHPDQPKSSQPAIDLKRRAGSTP